MVILIPKKKVNHMKFERIKALLWREWRIGRKSFMANILIFFIVVGFFWLIRLSMSVGNLAPVFTDSPLLNEFNGMIYYSAAALGAVIAFIPVSDLTCLQADINANWLRYSFALPVTPEIRAAELYICKFIKIAAAFALSVLNGLITAKITGTPFTGDMMWFFTAAAAACVLYDMLLQILCTKARTIKGLGRAQGKLLGTLTGIIMIYCFYKMTWTDSVSKPQPMNELIASLRNAFISHEYIIIPASLILLISCLLTGWYMTVRNYRMFGDAAEQDAAEKAARFPLKRKKEGEPS